MVLKRENFFSVGFFCLASVNINKKKIIQIIILNTLNQMWASFQRQQCQLTSICVQENWCIFENLTHFFDFLLGSSWIVTGPKL